MRLLLLLSLVSVVAASGEVVDAAGSGMPCPFTRELPCPPSLPAVTSTSSRSGPPPLSGKDAALAQNLLNRSPRVHPRLATDGLWGEQSCRAVRQFFCHGHASGVAAAAATGEDHACAKAGAGVNFTAPVAARLLAEHTADKYRDSGKISLPGSLYKVLVPVYRNRSVETTAALFDANMTKLLEFRVHTHGQNHPDGSALSELCPDGSTPTGLMSFDLNSPEGNAKLYGPYPINRAVVGYEGNAAIRRGENETFISDFRDGILLHTGEWSGWAPPMEMPNSHGCIHSWPLSIEKIWKLLVGLGVEVRKNPGGALPYPYKPQGELSVECLDC